MPVGRSLGFRIAALVAMSLGASAPAMAQSPVTSLAIERDHFVVNGQAKFLYMVSYFDAMRGSNVSADFVYLANNGVDGVRIFANWWLCAGTAPYGCGSYGSDTLFDGSGNLRVSRLTRLQQVLDDARNAGLVVDLTFTRETVSGLSVSNYRNGIVATTTALNSAAYEHVFFDIQNERDVSGDRYLSPSDVLSIRNAIKAVDSSRIVTASNSVSTPTQTGTFRASVGLDVAAHHDDRSPGWQDRTPAVVQDIWYADPWNNPVYLQEPQRYDREPVDNYYMAAAGYAKRYGAAAWTLHTGSTFNLTSGWTQVGEQNVIARIKNEIRPENWPACHFAIDRPGQHVGTSGGTVYVNLSSYWSCSWTAVKDDPGISWANIAGSSSGVGYGATIAINVAPGSGRSATFTLGTKTFTITQ